MSFDHEDHDSHASVLTPGNAYTVLRAVAECVNARAFHGTVLGSYGHRAWQPRSTGELDRWPAATPGAPQSRCCSQRTKGREGSRASTAEAAVRS